ncbi:hypothetical protein N7478_011072 [Penicillium angulare]|uniref:uncharacterized protein n=1 Tax=Penicillium angulare TaxID=116970 RepID=UPI002540FEF4|nr:uncharacterized protein N7478_011072 [Penicillium angulare]KAJ5263467.1 hypothetical protein N7478_011072 [Penicillium angulare]
MAEPPAKRARRVDSSAMWEKNDSYSRQGEPGSEVDHRRSPAPKDDRRDGPREDRRYRSRSRDRKNTRRERSWSRDRRDRDRRDRDRDVRPPQGRKRSTSRDRGFERRGYKANRDRSRSRSPARNGANARPGSRSPPRGYKDDRRPGRRDPRDRDDGRQANGSHTKDEMDIDFKEDADEDEMETMMRKAMGFTRFRTTKNTKVPGNDIYGVRKEKQIEYRQYMNRSGGFNRPLSPG